MADWTCRMTCEIKKTTRSEACTRFAERKCPKTLGAVCNVHSATVTSREATRRGDRRCAACGGVHSGPAWVGVV